MEKRGEKKRKKEKKMKKRKEGSAEVGLVNIQVIMKRGKKSLQVICTIIPYLTRTMINGVFVCKLGKSVIIMYGVDNNAPKKKKCF